MFSFRPYTSKLLVITGAFCLLMGLFLLVNSWYQLSHIAAQPVPLQLSQLGEQIPIALPNWVIFEGGHWDCTSLIGPGFGSSDARTKVLYVGDGTNVVYATLSGTISCEDLAGLAASGYLDTLNQKELTHIKSENPVVAQLPSNTTVYDLCGFCSPKNSRGGIFMGIFLMIGGLLIIYIGRGRQMRKLRIYGG